MAALVATVVDVAEGVAALVTEAVAVLLVVAVGAHAQAALPPLRARRPHSDDSLLSILSPRIYLLHSCCHCPIQSWF